MDSGWSRSQIAPKIGLKILEFYGATYLLQEFWATINFFEWIFFCFLRHCGSILWREIKVRYSDEDLHTFHFSSKIYFFIYCVPRCCHPRYIVIFILLGFGPVDYNVTARPLITKSCVVGNCRKKGTQCFRLKAAVTAWPFLLTLLLRALSCWSYGAVHCSNRINECYFTKKKCRRSVSLSKSRNSRGKSENICCVNNALNELWISINR